MNTIPDPISKKQMSEIRLLRQSGYRTESGLFVAEGERVVLDLLHSGLKVKFVACISEYYEQHKTLLTNTQVVLISGKDLDRISGLKTANKVIAVGVMPEGNEEIPVSGAVYLVLDGIRDPGNMGTLIRTAEWFGVRSIFCVNDCVDVWNPKVVQGAMGSVFRMHIQTTGVDELLMLFEKSGVSPVIAADLNGMDVSELASDKRGGVLIIGNEAHGISDALKGAATHKVRIPGSGAESLNAAVAAGILLYLLAK